MSRHRAREAVLMLLFQNEYNPDSLLEAAKLFWELHDSGPLVGGADREFADRIITACAEDPQRVDALIESSSEHWTLERMSAVDRAILRGATAEMLACSDVPATVTINEAVELAKHYSGEESGAFINGVLDRIHRDREGGTTT